MDPGYSADDTIAYNRQVNAAMHVSSCGLSPGAKQVKRSPTTPDGVTPSKCDGKIAAILCYSPWAP
jgi:hypothetical protein